MPTQDHLLVLGSTGPSGLDFVHAALREGHKLTLYVRNVSKLPAEVRSNALVTIIEGQLDDEAALEKAAGSGAQAVVSFIGPITGGDKNAPSILAGYKILVPKLIAHGIRRGLFLSTPSYTSPNPADGDTWSIRWAIIITLLRWIVPGPYREIVGMSKYIASQDTKEFRWTLFRVPNLRSGDATPVVTSAMGRDAFKWSLERKSLAEWVLTEVKEEKFVGRSPIIYNA